MVHGNDIAKPNDELYCMCSFKGKGVCGTRLAALPPRGKSCL